MKTQEALVIGLLMGPLSACHEQHHAWIELHRDQFYKNISMIKTLIGTQKKIAVVLKSNAYGHGLLPIAQLCEQNNFVDYLMVFLLSDALFLREQGITKPIIAAGACDADFNEAIKNNIEFFIYNQQTMDKVRTSANFLKMQTFIHLKVDTGLGRLGFKPEEITPVALTLQKNPYINIKGIASHFASASFDLDYTQKQLDIFMKTIKNLEEMGIKIPFQHIANSAAVLQFPQAIAATNMVRCGGIIYGLYKEAYLLTCAQQRMSHFDLKTIMTFKSTIISVKNYPAGSFIGYANMYQTTQPSRLAIVPIGYYDGYYRRLGNCGTVKMRNKLAPIVGRIAMNMMTIDVTHIPKAKEGDEVTLVNNDHGIRPRDIAMKLNFLDYETMQSLNPSIPRIII